MRLAALAQGIRDEHGDLQAQTAPYAYLLRRWGDSVDVAPLLDGFSDPYATAAIESALDEVDIEAVRLAYEGEGKDPAIYFYEDFLRAYDRTNARARGVHYSPPEVVSCIIRGVNHVLATSFGCSMDDALLIDPCCGVGTFLRHIERQTRYRPRTLGFELMPAAYLIATCLLRQTTVLNEDWLTPRELDTEEHVPVILGNPPYSGHSSNPGKLADLMADYREGLHERNPKWLQDDYVKFIRMAQYQIDRAGRGIVAFITNHSYLTNPTFRRMRESLSHTFDEILILDLHGNIKRHGGKHQNIFPIQMGVAISFLVKTADTRKHKTRYFSIDGDREEKLRTLADLDLSTVPWTCVPPVKPFHLFTPAGSDLGAEFYSFPSLFDIFRQSTVGFVTSRDKFALGFTRDEVLERIALLRDGVVSDRDLREKHGVGDLDIETARRELRNDGNWESKFIEVLYRPFDRRWTYYSRAIMERPRLPFMRNLMRDNLALAVGRAGNVTGSEEWDVVFCTDRPTDLNLFRRGGAKLFPAYVYDGSNRVSNVQMECDEPEALVAYIYAVLHSRAYRRRYTDLLSIDYPRIPVSRNADVFQALADAGRRLLQVHLLGHQSSPAPTAPRDAVVGIGGYVLPNKALDDRARLEDYAGGALITSAVSATIELGEEIDRIVSHHPPWTR